MQRKLAFFCFVERLRERQRVGASAGMGDHRSGMRKYLMKSYDLVSEKPNFLHALLYLIGVQASKLVVFGVYLSHFVADDRWFRT